MNNSCRPPQSLDTWNYTRAHAQILLLIPQESLSVCLYLPLPLLVSLLLSVCRCLPPLPSVSPSLHQLVPHVHSNECSNECECEGVSSDLVFYFDRRSLRLRTCGYGSLSLCMSALYGAVCLLVFLCRLCSAFLRMPTNVWL